MAQKPLKSLVLVDCPTIGNHHIQRNDVSRLLVVDSYGLTFSPLQYQALVLLIQGGVVAERDLIQAVYGNELYGDESKNLKKLIRRIRGKLSSMELTIVDVEKYGYTLLPIPL